jgi:glycosyltransferase involved in cell wall biosynthesis
MKIALVHELLTMRGGAERVLRILADMFPDAPIYTLLYDEKKLGDWFPKERVRTSSIQGKSTRLNHHLHLSRFPEAVEGWDFHEYDVVLSSSSAFAHGIITNSTPKHLCYVHSPARYLWDRTHDVLDRASKGPLGFLKKKYLEQTFHKLRIWDSEAAARPDKLVVPSKAVQRRCELYWRRESEIIPPPIDDFWFEENERKEKKDFYLVVSTLVPYKRIDIAIKACNKAHLPLKIIGEGPAKKELQKIAGSTVEFLGYRPQEELKTLYEEARALIVPGNEDFGLTPLEAMSCGTPTIAQRCGGPLETILGGETGEFFDKPNPESLLETMQKLEQKKYSESACKAQAKNFSRAKFEEGIRGAIDGLNRR